MLKTFGNRLKEMRLKRRLTQVQLAGLIGVQRASISQWENDDTQPKGRNLTVLCKRLNCDINWLQTGRKLTKEPDFLEGLSADAVIIIKRVAELDRYEDDRISAIRTLLGDPDLDI